MADRYVCTVNDKYRIASDGLQWVVQRFRGKDKDGKDRVSGVRYVRSTKKQLAYQLMLLGCPQNTVQHAIGEFPGTFAEWRSENEHIFEREDDERQSD